MDCSKLYVFSLHGKTYNGLLPNGELSLAASSDINRNFLSDNYFAGQLFLGDLAIG